jgi:hypothetical protein
MGLPQIRLQVKVTLWLVETPDLVPDRNEELLGNKNVKIFLLLSFISMNQRFMYPMNSTASI